MPVLRGDTVPVHARYDQVVEIHWRLADGKMFIERRTLPPKPTIAALTEEAGQPEPARPTS